jgi:lipid-A-disaccharide synthase-like uncharacterized protein
LELRRPQVLYGLIGEGIALLLSILTFIEAEEKGKIVLIALWALSFLLTIVFLSFIMRQVSLSLRLATGIGSFIYLSYQGYFRG